jgi:asparagine synthase (glutamine-hydrolysing)
MCGFVTWFRDAAEPWRPREESMQQQVLERIRHRGPDDGSEFREAGAWMGFRRLSILDLSDAGRQPMHFSGGRHVLVFNGEIYNFRELRQDLAGLELESTGDSAVLGTLLATQPVERVLEALRGMFAFAWWDREERTLVAARDPFGIKPLYFHERDGALLLGSELRSVSQVTGEKEISRRALAQLLRWGAVQAPDTLFRGIRCLPPGHLLTWKAGRLCMERYSRLAWPARDAWIRDESEQRDAARSTLLGSVKAHLVSDVPVGVFLSGGLDSTLMASCMRHLGQNKIKAFAIGYAEEAGVPDETDAAERTARYLGCDFFRERISADSLEARLEHFFDELDQPTGDALNTWLVSALAAREVKVALSGLGADEWFGGYNYMRLAALAERSPVPGTVPGKACGAIMRSVEKMLPQQMRGHRYWKALFYAAGGAGAGSEQWHRQARTIVAEDELCALLGMRAAEIAEATLETPERRQLVDSLDDRAPNSALHRMLLLETESYLANTLLRDNDSTSMAHSLELRVPLVDREMFALAGRVPPEAKLTLSGGKRIFREAMADLLPPWIVEDRQKKTFTLPLMKWMRYPRWRQRIHDTLRSQRCRERGLINSKLAARAVEHFEKSPVDTKAAWAMSQKVWMMLVLESWALRNA